MATVEKTALELADLIRTAVGFPELRVAVFADLLGWHAKVYGAGLQSLEIQTRVDSIATHMNRHYKLAQER